MEIHVSRTHGGKRCPRMFSDKKKSKAGLKTLRHVTRLPGSAASCQSRRQVGGAEGRRGVGRSRSGDGLALNETRQWWWGGWEGQSPECKTTVHASFKQAHAPFIYKKHTLSWRMWHHGLTVSVQSHDLQVLQTKNRNLKGFHIDR